MISLKIVNECRPPYRAGRMRALGTPFLNNSQFPMIALECMTGIDVNLPRSIRRDTGRLDILFSSLTAVVHSD